jgi:hypothetical protein
MHPALPALSLVCLTSLATAVQAQDSRITQVTVYPGSATVQRTLQVPPVHARPCWPACPPGWMHRPCRSVHPPA